MSHVLTVKIPHSLLQRLDELSRKEGRSKGALVRWAIERFLQGASAESSQVERITEAFMKGKNPKMRTDWKMLYAQTRKPSSMTPEEEVRRSRRRDL